MILPARRSPLSRARSLLPLLPALALLSGCGTIVRGTTQHVAVDSAPQGAAVRTDTGLSGQTPTSFALKRNVPHTITCSLAGHRETSVVVNPTMSGGGTAGLVGNVVFGGLIGAAVDAGSGAMYDLHPESVFCRLEPEPAPEDAALPPPRARTRTRS